MAVKIDMSGSEDLQAQIDKERRLIFRIVRIGLAVVCVGSLVFAGFKIVKAYNSVASDNEVAVAEKAKLDKLNADIAEWHDKNDKKSTDVNKEGKVVSTIQLPSAALLGSELADLQNAFYEDSSGKLIYEDKIRLQEIVGTDKISNSCWFGDRLNPAETPVKWEFVTFYDSSPTSTNSGPVVKTEYECTWLCRYKAPSGKSYIVALTSGTYYGASDMENGKPSTGSFKINSIYVTNYGKMLNDSGSIEVAPSDGNEVAENASAMVEALTTPQS